MMRSSRSGSAAALTMWFVVASCTGIFGSKARAQNPMADAIAAAASDSAAKATAGATFELDRVSRLYNVAGRLFGYEHVLLTAVAYSGRRCRDAGSNTFWSCNESEAGGKMRATRTGIGGLVGVPLLGGGAGHGAFDWWPRFETRSAAEVYIEYQQSAEKWVELISKFTKVDEVDPESRRKSLLTAARALKSLLDREVAPYQDPDEKTEKRADHASEWPIRLRQCVEDLITRLTALESKTKPSSGLNAVKDVLTARGLLGTAPVELKAGPRSADVAEASLDAGSASISDFFALTAELETAAGPRDASAAQGHAGYRELTARSLLDGGLDAGSSAAPELSMSDELISSAEELRGLLDAYRQLSHSGESPRGRHTYLIGPAVVIPVQDITREWMYGVVLEVGKPFLRLTATGGFRLSYDNPYIVAPYGWFAGIGISGEFADDFFHWANGASSAAAKLRTEIGGRP
jgi:hypothetical protein